MSSAALDVRDPASLRQRWPGPASARPIVLIGAGGIANDAHLPAYRSQGWTVSGVYDRDPARARATAERWGIPRVHASMAEAVGGASGGAGVVFDVAVPPAELRSVVEALPEGSAALLQKPFGRDLVEASLLRELCRARRLTAAVNLQLRFAPVALALADAIERGWLGELVELEVRVACHMPWERWPFLVGLPRMEIALHSIHYLDLVRALLGEPRAVHARTLPHPRAPGLANTRTSAILDYGMDLRCTLSVGHAHVWGARHQHSEVRVEGTRGAARAVLGVNLDYPRGRPDELELALEPASASRPDPWRAVPLCGSWFPDAFAGPMASLQRALAGEEERPRTSVEDAWRTMALVEACYASDAAAGTPVPPVPSVRPVSGRAQGGQTARAVRAARAARPMHIDAHQHFWRLERGDYAWLTPSLAGIHRDFGPEDLEPLLAAAGVAGTVLVQAAPTADETEFLLGLAARTEFVRGVVGWTALDAPGAPREVERLAAHAKLVGLRPMLQDLPDDGWIARPELAPAMDAMERNGLALDALVRPRHLAGLLALVERRPGLDVVIDHCAKPSVRRPRGAWPGFAAWRAALAALARHPRVHCKLSGLATEFAGAPAEWASADLEPYFEVVLEEFGPDRVLWGSDWPVVELAGGYGRWWESSLRLLEALGADEREAVLGGNARRVYGLEVRAA